MQNLVELLLARRSTSECGIRFSAKDVTWTYQECVEQAARQAGALRRRVEPGARVLIVGENSPELVLALLACWWSGCTPSCFAPPNRMQAHSNFDGGLQEAVRAGQFELGLCPPQLLPRCRKAPLDWLPLPLPAEEPRSPAPAPEIAYLQFSSGTTLQPKPTQISQQNMLANLEAIASELPGDRRSHRAVSWLPLYHDMGLVGCLLGGLYVPGPLCLMSPTQFALRPGRWLDEIAAERATITAAPNFALEQLLERDPRPGRDLSCVQKLLLGAETILPETLRRFHEVYSHQGLRWEALTPVYGLAEATLAVTFSHGPKLGRFQVPRQLGGPVTSGAREILSLGTPVRDVRVEIRDEQGERLGEDRLGLIYVDGPGVAHALPRPFNTGDVGFLHRGELYFVTRHKDVLVYHGRKHDPEWVETLVYPLSAAVVSSEEERAVCLAERPRCGSDAEEVYTRLREALTQAPLPVEAVLVEPGWLPRTTSGKISRHRARQKYLEENHRA